MTIEVARFCGSCPTTAVQSMIAYINISDKPLIGADSEMLRLRMQARCQRRLWGACMRWYHCGCSHTSTLSSHGLAKLAKPAETDREEAEKAKTDTRGSRGCLVRGGRTAFVKTYPWRKLAAVEKAMEHNSV